MTRFARGLAGALLLLLAAGSARADALVRVAPHRTAIGGHADSRPLYGYLARPAGRGTIPAVVVLHGCGGMGPSDVTTAATLRSWGYVALALDSLGNANTCGQTGGAVAEAFDAYAALKYLAALRDVDPRRVAVVGFSMGGVAALQILETGLIEQLWPEHFRAAVAYYPQCQSSSGVMSAPVLILIGDRDDWAPAAACRAMLARRGGKGAPVSLVVFKGATHAFNLPEPRRRYLGHLLAYDPAATRDALARMRLFLSAALAAPPALRPAAGNRTVPAK